MNVQSHVIFCDFDGTVARRDIGYHLFRRFTDGQCDTMVADWKSGSLSTRDCLLQEAAWFHGKPDDVYAFLDDFDLNPGFTEFTRRAEQNGIPLYIISDGLDLYIDFLLSKHGVGHLPRIFNHATLIDSGLRLEFPYPDPHNTGGGVCNGERIAEYRHRQNGPITVIFVGDGLSDVDALPHSDLLFAKKDLARYCDRHNIPYTSFDTFHDVTRECVTRSLFPM